ncbi:MAG TPA: tetratricopeptide repeat protein [Candidatus Methylacidiphilales bacterium]|nr:tetratricopeptide repeat protein [Candidatus Methylacidiphilales bacterium]
MTVPLSLAHAEQTLQQRYLDIWVKLHDAENLEKQGDFRGALDDYKDCYAKFQSIHEEDPNWEAALVAKRMDDCKAKIIELEPEAEAQPPPASNPTGPTTLPPVVPPSAPSSDEVAALRLQLQAVQDDLRITKDKLRESQAQLETYQTQLQTVNAQLAAVKSQQSVDDRMGKLLSDNKALTEKLADAEQEIDAFKTDPKSKLAMAQAQLKNLQDQYNASQEANKALQDTTTTLKQQLDQANADLVAANQKLAAAGTGSPEYETLKRENEIMRDILTRELQEQAHRDMAKRLAQEEFDNLKLKSKVLQEQLDILGSPMTPPTNDQERALLASLKVPGPDVTQPAGGGSFVATLPGSGNSASTGPTTTNPPAMPGSSVPDTNGASVTPPVTNSVAAATDGTTNPPPVVVVMNDQTTTGDGVSDPSTTNTVASATPPSAPAQTNVVDPNVPLPPTAPSTTASAPTPPTSPTAPPAPPTTSHVSPGTTTYTETTIDNGANAPKQDDPDQYSTKARLPDDMRETAQDAADLFKDQKYDESAAKYQTIIDKYPESLYAWSNLGVVRFQQGKYDDALKALQQAVKLSPTDAFSYSNLGIVYYQLQQYENAIDALNSAQALDPNDAKTHNYLGCAESQKGWEEASEKEFRKAIEIDPNFGDAHFNLALVYATSKPPSLELARREYNRALELGIAKDARLEKLLQGSQ